jgi:hypothetical protein
MRHLLPLLVAGIAAAAPRPLIDGLATAGLSYDAATGRLAPAAADEPATIVYDFGVISAAPRLSLAAVLRHGDPQDAATVEVLGEDGSWLPAARWTWQSGPLSLDLSPRLPRRGAFAVRLTLASHRPERFSLRDLTWDGAGLERTTPAEAWLPWGAWLYPAFAALRDQRLATGLPPGPLVELGLGRLTVTPDLAWTRCAGGFEAVWQAPPAAPETTRLARLAGPGRLSLDGRLLAACDLADMPLGGELPAAGGPLRLTFDGPAEPRLTVQTCGGLELRYCRPRPRWHGDDCRLWLDVVVVNHLDHAVDGNLSAELGGSSEDESPRRTAGGYEFPPGPSLAPLVFDLQRPARWQPGRPVLRRLKLAVDDGARRLDSSQQWLGLTAGGWEDGPRLDGRRLKLLAAPVETALEPPASSDQAWLVSAPAPPELVDRADREGRPLVIAVGRGRPELWAAQQMLYGGRPSVLAVLAGEP